MNRLDLIEQLHAYGGEPEEEPFRKPMIDLLQSAEGCFYRDYFDPGHMTGSGLLMNKQGDKVLMNHHKIMNIWVCFGGHADGDEDILAVATREVIEESGISAIQLAHQGIFDIDIHPIPFNAKKNELAHRHFDITYLFQLTDDVDFVMSDESLNLKWCSLDEAQMLVPHGSDPHMHRLLRKWSKTLV